MQKSPAASSTAANLDPIRPRQISIPFVKEGVGFFEVTGKKFPKLQAAQSKRRHLRGEAPPWL
jgi:hypothetical protein